MCKQCEEKPVYEFTNKRKLCGNCFIRYFNKKILYIIRKFKMSKNGDVILYQNKRNFKDVVLEEALKFFSSKSNAKIVKLKSLNLENIKEIFKKRKKLSIKIAVSSTLDNEAEEIISGIIFSNIKNSKANPVEKKIKNTEIIKPLYLFLDEEILLYAKLKKLKFENTLKKKDKISLLIDYLERKHPEIKRAVVNSYLKIKK